MKTVFNNKQLAHIWAHQKQAYGKTPDKNFYFEGAEIFSYGSHYMAGKIYNVKGEKIAVLNDYNYSPSTARHLSHIRNALSGLMPYISLPEVSELKHEKNIKHILDKLEKSYSDAETRMKITYVGAIDDTVEWIEKDLFKANEYLKLIGRVPKKLDEKRICKIREHLFKRYQRYLELNTPEAIAKKEEQSAKRLLAKNKKELGLQALAILNFREGKTHGTINLQYDLLKIQGDEVVTSRGARVPLKIAKNVLKKYLAGESVDGVALNDFQIDNVTALGTDSVFKIGCHKILLSEACAVLKG